MQRDKRSKWAIDMDRRLERMREDPEAYVEEAREAARSHGPTLTADGVTEAILAAARKRAAARRALRRDGGER